jgi:hypothetical protein
MRKVVASPALWVLVGLLGAYVVWGIYTRHRYLTAFEATKPGETLEVVLKRFGQPSHIEPHYSVSGYDSGEKSVCGQSCWLRLWYELPFDLGVSPVTVDFNSQQVVIDKYQWSSP